jgi:hypothetical protein
MALTFGFDASKGETPESVASRRKSADMLAARIFGRTPQNLGEGLNSIGQAFIARQMLDEANAAQSAGAASGNDAYSQIVSALSGGGAPAAPVASAPMGALPAMPPPQNIAPGKIYSNDEPSPLDPPAGADRDAAVRTVLAEAGNQGATGMNAVASVIRNRAVAGNFGGDTAGGVVQAPNQFEPWNTQGGRDKMAAIDPNSPQYKAASGAVDQAYFGNDPTNGAKNFIQPTLQTALGRPMPKWAQAPGTMIGDHKFIGGAPQTEVASAEDGAELPANAAPVQGALPSAESVRGSPGPSLQVLMQAASNPWLSEGQRTVVNTMLKQRLESEQQAQDPLRQAQIKLTTAKASKAENGGDTEFGLNPIYGKDDQGNDVLGVLGKDGTFKKIDTQGVKLNSGVEKIDLGTHFQLRDKRSGQIVGTERKDVAGVERLKAEGEAQGKANVAAPADIQSGQNALDILDKIEKHPSIGTGTGATGVVFNRIPGTGGYDFQNLVEQAKGGAFLQAIQQMRGLGSLSNAEGGAATSAVTRMNTATSKEAFLDAVNDFRTIVKQGMDRGKARLANPTATNPKSEPSVDDLLKKYGG